MSGRFQIRPGELGGKRESVASDQNVIGNALRPPLIAMTIADENFCATVRWRWHSGHTYHSVGCARGFNAERT
jgi:hypothetical protein